MLFNIPFLEWVGYAGSVVVAVSLTMSSIKKLRWYNLLGASIFSFYGFAIGAFPVGFLNLFIVLADIYYLYKMYSYKESFEAVEVGAADAYTQSFVQHYRADIQEFFPAFETNYISLRDSGKEAVILLLMRDAVVAGIFMGTKENNELSVILDFVTKPYRDFKPGDFIYKTNLSAFKNKGIDTLICETGHKIHQKYLLRMGFTASDNGLVYTKNL